MSTPSQSLDVVVIGEALVELSSREPLTDGATLRLGFSGDALNAAAAAAAAGARTGLLTKVPNDDLGDRLVERIAAVGISTELIIRAAGQHGIYLQHADPAGAREFIYARGSSAASTLSSDDVPADVVSAAGVVLASGIACAVSPTLASAVRRAADLAARFIYDPNWRSALGHREQRGGDIPPARAARHARHTLLADRGDRAGRLRARRPAGSLRGATGDGAWPSL